MTAVQNRAADRESLRIDGSAGDLLASSKPCAFSVKRVARSVTSRTR
jgi:hypothetical protein